MFSYISPAQRVPKDHPLRLVRQLSQRWRKAIEHPFGWLKAAAGIRQVKVKGRRVVDSTLPFGMAAYNLVRLRGLVACGA